MDKFKENFINGNYEDLLREYANDEDNELNGILDDIGHAAPRFKILQSFSSIADWNVESSQSVEEMGDEFYVDDYEYYDCIGATNESFMEEVRQSHAGFRIAIMTPGGVASDLADNYRIEMLLNGDDEIAWWSLFVD